ncbi:MAG: hypothetical protein LBQ47_08065, partial [Endomicrobium sp.]|nr:hypothetical protein [Endomicrobium sp.]
PVEAAEKLLEELKNSQADAIKEAAKDKIALTLQMFSFTADAKQDTLISPYSNEDLKKFFALQLETAKILGVKSVSLPLSEVFSKERNLDAYISLVKEAAASEITVNFENSFKDYDENLSGAQLTFSALLRRGYIEKNNFIKNLALIKDALSPQEQQYLGITFNTSKALNSYTSSIERRSDDKQIEAELKKINLDNLIDYYEALENSGLKINNIRISHFSAEASKAIAQQALPAKVFYNTGSLDGTDNPNLDMVDFLKYLSRKNYKGALNQETPLRISPSKTEASKPQNQAVSKRKGSAMAGLNMHDISAQNANYAEILELFGAAYTDETGDIYTNVYFMETVSSLTDQHLQNIGWKTDGQDVWISRRGDALFVLSNARAQSIIKDFAEIISSQDKIKGSQKTLKQIKKTTGFNFENAKPAIIINHSLQDDYGTYNEDGTLVISANILGEEKSEIFSNLSKFNGIRNIQAKALAEQIYMDMDVKNLSEFQKYLAILNAVEGKNLIVDFEIFKDVDEDKIMKITSLAKNNGIRVFVKETNPSNISERRNKMRTLGFQGYVIQRNDRLFIYDNISLDEQEIEIVSGYKNKEDLEKGLQSGSKPKALKLSELLDVFDGADRSLTGKIAVLETFKSALLKISRHKMQDKDYVRKVGYNFARREVLSDKNIKDFCQALQTNDVLQAQAALNIKTGDPALLYLRQLEKNIGDNPQLDLIKMEFLKGLIIQSLSRAELEKAGVDTGLANEEFEILLGEKLLQKYIQAINNSEVEAEIDEFIASDAKLNEFNDKIRELAAQNRPQAINAVIKLILLSERKIGQIDTTKTLPFSVSSINSILSAA